MRQTIILTVLSALLALCLPAAGFAVEINWTEHPIVENWSTNVMSVSAIDIDGDGDLDVLGSGSYWGGGDLSWWENDGEQNFTEHNVSHDANFWQCFGVDMDSDGDIDILTRADFEEAADHRITIWVNDGNQNFVQHDIASDWTNQYKVYATDLDDDGDLDIIVGHDPQHLYWLENVGNLSFTEHTIDGSFSGVHRVYADDLDSDGDVDVIASSHTDDLIAWWENDGNQSFTKHSLVDSLADASSLCAADVDRDGDRDLLAVSGQSGRTSWFENDGQQNFTERNIHTGGVPSSVFAADLDLDGDMDVLGTNQSNGGDNKVRWWENDGQQNFTEYVIRSNFYGAYSGSAADFDGDRDLDVLACAYYGKDISWWESDLDPVDIAVIVTPQNPPVCIPRHGGDFRFDWGVINNRDTSVIVDTWTVSILPNGSRRGPLKLIDSLFVPARGDTAYLGMKEHVRGNAPTGTYRYVAYVGFYPDSSLDSSYFEFTKLPCLEVRAEPLDTVFRAPCDTLRFDLWVTNCDEWPTPVWGSVKGKAYSCDGEVIHGPKQTLLASNLQAGETLYGRFYVRVRYRPEEALGHAGIEISVGPREGFGWVDSTCYVVLVEQPWSSYAGKMSSEGPEILEWGPVEDVEITGVQAATLSSLGRNFPNPFNVNTEIAYDLAQAGPVRLEVFDIQGRKVVTLVGAEQPAGRHTITWDASEMASGIYFYKLTAGDFTETRRMTLLK